jgi:hypothetical protein
VRLGLVHELSRGTSRGFRVALRERHDQRASFERASTLRAFKEPFARYLGIETLAGHVRLFATVLPTPTGWDLP